MNENERHLIEWAFKTYIGGKGHKGEDQKKENTRYHGEVVKKNK